MRRAHTADKQQQWSSHALSPYGLAKYITNTRHKSSNSRALLNLSHWPITDDDLSVVSSAGLGVNSLSLRHCLRISDHGLLHLRDMQRGVIGGGLKILDLAGCVGLTDRTCSILADSLPRLHSVDLSCCDRLSDRGLCSLLGGCKYLEKIILQHLQRLSNPSIDAMRTSIVMFRRLHAIGECVHVVHYPCTIFLMVGTTQRMHRLDAYIYIYTSTLFVTPQICAIAQALRMKR